MGDLVVTVLFSREGPRNDVELDPSREYQVRVDGGPASVFRSPWGQDELEDHLECLRNVGDGRPDIERARSIGRSLGERLGEIEGIRPFLGCAEPVTICWQLDYPELARIPWELATATVPPHHHLLLSNVSFVRKVPALLQDAPAQWPTGRAKTLRVLFVWGERSADEVPHRAHLESLQGLCDEYGVELTAQEIPDIAALTDLCSQTRYHFVHLLAHGAMAANREWGLRLKHEVVKGEQIARALRAGGTTPAVATVAACDSANEKDGSFGSVAYQLHMYGVPLVIASQFRLRKSVSVVSAGAVYRSLLGGSDPLSAMRDLRRRLATADNESWANEVVYSRYRQESLSELFTDARQQAALRRARAIARRNLRPGEYAREAIDALRQEVENLTELAKALEAAERRDPAAEAETYGLIGSLHRRVAALRADPPDPEDLRTARSYYERGFQADANSHYCGVNVVHLCLRVGDWQKAEGIIPFVRLVAKNDIRRGRDFWAYASAGELEVYARRADGAAENYRRFAAAVDGRLQDPRARVDALESARRQLTDLVKVFSGGEHTQLRSAAEGALHVLDSAIRRNS